MSMTNNKSDQCFLTQHEQNNKSIFQYMVDNSMFVNKNKCNDFTPPFMAYRPFGVSAKNSDIENDLKGIIRPLTKCENCKYQPGNTVGNATIQDQECKKEFRIIPNGYLMKN